LPRLRQRGAARDDVQDDDERDAMHAVAGAGSGPAFISSEQNEAGRSADRWPDDCTEAGVLVLGRRFPAGFVILRALPFAMASLACSRLPPQRYALDRIEFAGNEAIDDDELEERMASRESPRFAGVLAGVFDEYEVFDRYVLERDLERIQRFYRARGGGSSPQRRRPSRRRTRPPPRWDRKSGRRSRRRTTPAARRAARSGRRSRR
jgi:hypothetical protein